MADQWHVIYEAATGRLVSEGTVVAVALPVGLAIKAVPRPDDAMMWDSALLDFIPRPPAPVADRVVDFAEDPSVKPVLLKLSVEDRQALSTALATMLGRRRFRFSDQLKEMG